MTMTIMIQWPTTLSPIFLDNLSLVNIFCSNLWHKSDLKRFINTFCLVNSARKTCNRYVCFSKRVKLCISVQPVLLSFSSLICTYILKYSHGLRLHSQYLWWHIIEIFGATCLSLINKKHVLLVNIVLLTWH